MGSRSLGAVGWRSTTSKAPPTSSKSSLVLGTSSRRRAAPGAALDLEHMTDELLVAGSIALDTLEGSFGVVNEELGGSALYFALAASLIMPVRILAPVGRETAGAVRDVIGSR